MANAAPKIVARNFHEAHTFAREVLKLSQGTYRVVANPAALFGYGEVHLVPGWDKRPDRFAVRNKLRYTRLTVIDHEALAQKESTRKVETTALKCRFCSLPDSECACVFHCSECDSEMMKDEIAGGSLCPQCDAPRSEPDETPTNGDNMLSEGAPLFEVPDTLLDDIREQLQITPISGEVTEAPQEIADELESNPLPTQEELEADEIHDVDTRHTPEEWAEKLAEQEEWQARGPRADGTFAEDDKPAEEQEITKPEPEPAGEDNGVKEDDSDNDVEEDERPLNGRRRRRCKDCGDLIHPDDVDEHAAEEATKKAALEKKAQERLK